jgi:MinD superfamily P-loop ATPase
MRELVVISGKGGTGKTSLTAAFAYLAKNKVLCDTDVDAADLHLLLNPDIRKRFDFSGGHRAVIDHDSCIQCGLCLDLCRFSAIGTNYVVNPLNCEGCGVCVDLCPVNAIAFPEKICGEWYISDTRLAPMIHARLGIAEENSGKLVTVVRKAAKELAITSGAEIIITDGPPGVGCPVIASLGGATAVVVVTEPTISGLHDMKRVVQLARGFRVPVMVCINKYDLNPVQGEQMIQTIKDQGLRYLGNIPYDPSFTRAMIERKTIMEFAPRSEAAKAVENIWEQILRAPEMNVITELVIGN